MSTETRDRRRSRIPDEEYLRHADGLALCAEKLRAAVRSGSRQDVRSVALSMERVVDGLQTLLDIEEAADEN